MANREDAEEVMQDVFVKVHEKFEQFEERSQLRTWVYRITVNTCLDRIKASRRQKRFGMLTSIFDPYSGKLKYDTEGFDHPGVELERKEEYDALYALIRSLPERQASAIVLSRIQGLSHKEIAEILGVSPKAIESLVARAIKALKEKLSPREGDEE